MPTPIAPRIILPQNARSDLQTLMRAHSTPQSLALRARIVLNKCLFYLIIMTIPHHIVDHDLSL
jgi:hypothetical protein